MSDRVGSSAPRPEEKGNSYFLLLYLIRSVVEKHGGHMEIDENAGTYTVTISEGRKAACLRELKETIGPSKPLSEVSFLTH